MSWRSIFNQVTAQLFRRCRLTKTQATTQWCNLVLQTGLSAFIGHEIWELQEFCLFADRGNTGFRCRCLLLVSLVRVDTGEHADKSERDQSDCRYKYYRISRC